MSFLGKLIYKYYYRPKQISNTIKSYGGKEKYFEMRVGEAEMRAYALNNLIITSPFSKSGKFQLHFLTGEKFIHQTLFCIYSLSVWLNEDEAKNFSITLFDDNSLKNNTLKILKVKFPQLIILPYKETVEKVKTRFPIKNYPFINKKITELFFFNKLFFLHADSNSGLKIYLDSDMLFVNRPDEFLNWMNANWDKRGHAFSIEDIKKSYGYDESTLQKIANNPVNHQINAGFYGIQTENINFDEVERLINNIDKNYGSSYYMEQFITSLILVNQKNLTIFPRKDYIVWPTHEDVQCKNGVLHHYVDISKYDYFTQSWRRFTEQN